MTKTLNQALDNFKQYITSASSATFSGLQADAMKAGIDIYGENTTKIQDRYQKLHDAITTGKVAGSKKLQTWNDKLEYIASNITDHDLKIDDAKGLKMLLDGISSSNKFKYIQSNSKNHSLYTTLTQLVTEKPTVAYYGVDPATYVPTNLVINNQSAAQAVINVLKARLPQLQAGYVAPATPPYVAPAAPTVAQPTTAAPKATRRRRAAPVNAPAASPAPANSAAQPTVAPATPPSVAPVQTGPGSAAALAASLTPYNPSASPGFFNRMAKGLVNVIYWTEHKAHNGYVQAGQAVANVYDRIKRSNATTINDPNRRDNMTKGFAKIIPGGLLAVIAAGMIYTGYRANNAHSHYKEEQVIAQQEKDLKLIQHIVKPLRKKIGDLEQEVKKMHVHTHAIFNLPSSAITTGPYTNKFAMPSFSSGIPYSPAIRYEDPLTIAQVQDAMHLFNAKLGTQTINGKKVVSPAVTSVESLYKNGTFNVDYLAARGEQTIQRLLQLQTEHNNNFENIKIIIDSKSPQTTYRSLTNALHKLPSQ